MARKSFIYFSTVYASIWLPFIGIGLYFVIHSSQHDVIEKTVFVSLNAIFVASYLYFWIQSDKKRFKGLPVQQFDRDFIAVTLIMVTCIFAVGSIEFSSAFYLTNYLAALFLFGLSLRKGIWLVGGQLIMMLMAYLYLNKHNAFSLGAFISILVGTVIVALMATVSEITDREQQLEKQQLLLEERSEISRDLHDILGHTLTAINLKTQVANHLLPDDPHGAKRELEQVQALTSRAISEVRETVGQLRSPQLADQLKGCVQVLKDAGVNVRVSGEAEQVPVIHRALFAWAIREATTNIVRHAHATEVEIRLESSRLVVSDNGIGIGDSSDGHGVTGLKSRASRAGARVSVGAVGNNLPGTKVEVSFD